MSMKTCSALSYLLASTKYLLFVHPFLMSNHVVWCHQQERLTSKEQQIGDNFYVRGDGTVSFSSTLSLLLERDWGIGKFVETISVQRAYYFSEDFLSRLFRQNGFDVEVVGICNKKVENRSLELVMKRYSSCSMSKLLYVSSGVSTKCNHIPFHWSCSTYICWHVWIYVPYCSSICSYITGLIVPIFRFRIFLVALLI